jgi:hypothetical protein
MTTAKAPVAPEIIPGLPPNTEVIRPTIKAAYNPTRGSTPATKAKATASGTRARATVIPDKTSFFTFGNLLLINSVISMILKSGKYTIFSLDGATVILFTKN